MPDHDLVGTFQVWHKERDGFHHVADVESNWVGAVVLPLFKVPHDNVKYLPGWDRPTTFGDKIVDPTGQAYEIQKDRDLQAAALRESSHPRRDNYNQQMAEQARRMPQRQQEKELQR